MMFHKLRLIDKDQSGFTLVEIIAVLIILAVLAAVAVPKYFSMQETAEKKVLYKALIELKSRANSAYSQSLMKYNGKPKLSDYNTFIALGVTENEIDDIFVDFAGNWSWSNTVLNYMPGTFDNDGKPISFTIIAPNNTKPAKIVVSEDLSE